MWRISLIGVSTLVLALVGLYIGATIHGLTVRALLACICGAAGGFGIGVIAFDIWRHHQHQLRGHAEA